jgi:putative copper resistance protein D
MTDNSVALGLRAAHLVACVLVVGHAAGLLLAGRPERPTARAWEARITTLGAGALAAAVATGLGVLAWQTALVEGRRDAALDVAALWRFARDTQGGHVWLARHGLLALLGGFAALGGRAATDIDWLALRAQTALLGGAGLALLAVAGHAAAVEPGAAGAIVVDALHLATAGAWVGALLPVALLVRATSEPAGADARPYAVLAVRRFSALATGAVVVVGATGIANAIVHVGSFAGLVGTGYGRRLLLKLALVATTLAIAAVNRRRLLPAIGGEAEHVGRPAMRRLAKLLVAEAAAATAVLTVAAGLGLTPPARHVEPIWPLPFRLEPGALTSGAARWRALVGSQLVVLGLALAAAWFVGRSRHRATLAGAAVAAVGGLVIAVPPLALEAYPTTYARPAVPYRADSIARGAALYREHCAGCHAVRALAWGRVERHTAGDLYWWITRGIPRMGMPGFGTQLDDEARWDLVNFIRTLDAGRAAGRIDAIVQPARPWLAAPDFDFTVGPTPPRALRAYRGRRLVLVTLYSLPFSRPRLAQLAKDQNLLAALGLEIVAVPRAAGPDAIKRLADGPRILFPIVTGGAADIVAAYDLLGRGRHAEFLVDRQGYIRARWIADDDPRRDVAELLANVRRLNEEPVAVAAADEHVH